MKELLIALLQVALVETLTNVVAYIGETAILPSGADPSWTLSLIDWSVYPNITHISTYQQGLQIVESFGQFQGRLSLSLSSGDLTIRDVQPSDAMVYSVDLISNKGQDKANKVNLRVRKRLQEPAIVTIGNYPKQEGCYLVLKCSSPDDGVALSWQSPPDVITSNLTSNQIPKTTFLLAIINTTRGNVSISCMARNDMENASHVITKDCGGEKSPTELPPSTMQPCPKPPQPRNSYAVVFIFGTLTGGVLTILFYCLKQKLIAVASKTN